MLRNVTLQSGISTLKARGPKNQHELPLTKRTVWVALHQRTAGPPSAKRSTCCGAGRVFWTADRSSEPTVVLGYCDDPLEYWSAVVLGWAFIFSCFSGTFRKLPMSEYVDLANSTRLRRVFFVPSHQVLKERGKYPPSPPPETSRSRPTVTTPQQSQKLLSIFTPPHCVSVVRWRVFEYSMCVS